MEEPNLTLEEASATLQELFEKLQCVGDPYTVGPQGVSANLSIAANCLLTAGNIKQSLLRMQADLDRRVRIAKELLERLVAETAIKDPEISKLRTKDERRIFAQSKHADKSSKINDFVAQLNEVNLVLDYLESLRSDIRQVIKVHKMQLESMWRDNVDSALPTSQPNSWRSS